MIDKNAITRLSILASDCLYRFTFGITLRRMRASAVNSSLLLILGKRKSHVKRTLENEKK